MLGEVQSGAPSIAGLAMSELIYVAGLLDQAEKSFTELQEKVTNAANQCTIS